MGYLKAIETDELRLPSHPDFWVRMRKEVHHGATRAAQSALMQFNQVPQKPNQAPQNGQPNGQAPEVVTEMEVGAWIGALTVALITEWNLTDEQDRPLPITLKNLDKLKDEDGDFLTQEAQKRKGAMRPNADQGPFPTPSDKPSAASRSRTPK